MEIKVPPDLNSQELKCFNEIVKPQLEELYSYDYDKFKFRDINLFISREVKLNIEEIKIILNKIPEKDSGFIKEIYFVSYNCRDDNDKVIRGRTLPVVHKIVVYPKAYDRLKVILTHEIGHIIFEKKLTKELKQLFTFFLLQTFPQARFGSSEEYHWFITEQFADSYEIFTNNPERLKEFLLLHKFFMENINQLYLKNRHQICYQKCSKY